MKTVRFIGASTPVLSVSESYKYFFFNFCNFTGKLRELKVPQETFVNLPVIEDEKQLSKQLDNCYHLCYCNIDGNLVDCKLYCTNQRPEKVLARAEKTALEQM